MAYQIIRCPDGSWALWETIVDDFVFEGVTEDVVLEHVAGVAAEHAYESAQRIIEQLRDGKKAYYQRTMTYEEACAWRDEVHREEDG